MLVEVKFPNGSGYAQALSRLTGACTSRLDTIGLESSDYPEKQTRLIELSQTCDRASVHEACANCVTPGGRQFITSRCRILRGREKLRIQGMWLADESVLDGFADAVVGDMAGNAFEACCCSASIFACLSLLAHFHEVQVSARRAVQSIPRLMPAGADLDEEPDELDQVWFRFG